MNPLLKWAGGKRWQLPHLQPLWTNHRHRRLVEPFVGGMAATFSLSPERALLNDINPHLMNFYYWVKRGLTITMPMTNDEAMYYAYRERLNQLRPDCEESAALFYYLNRTCYNGLCRFNQRGGFNTPFGDHPTINYIRDFAEYRSLFRRWKFTCIDFERIPLADGDFVYSDPPYDGDDGAFTQYAKPFRWADQVRAARWLAKHRGPVVASNLATDRIVRLYRELGFDLGFVKGPRQISCKGGGRKPVLEVIATRNLAASRELTECALR